MWAYPYLFKKALERGITQLFRMALLYQRASDLGIYATPERCTQAHEQFTAKKTTFEGHFRQR